MLNIVQHSGCRQYLISGRRHGEGCPGWGHRHLVTGVVGGMRLSTSYRQAVCY